MDFESKYHCYFKISKIKRESFTIIPNHTIIKYK